MGTVNISGESFRMPLNFVCCSHVMCALECSEWAIISNASPKVAQNGILLKERALSSSTVICLIFDPIPWSFRSLTYILKLQLTP